LNLSLQVSPQLVSLSGSVACNVLCSCTSDGKSDSAASAHNLTASISSALFPRFRYVSISIHAHFDIGAPKLSLKVQITVSSQDGKILLFLSAKQAVNSGAHNATDSLHKINWLSDWEMDKQLDVTEVVCPSVYLALFFTVFFSLFSF